MKLFGWLLGKRSTKQSGDDFDITTMPRVPEWAQQRNVKFEAKLEQRRRMCDVIYGDGKVKR